MPIYKKLSFHFRTLKWAAFFLPLFLSIACINGCSTTKKTFDTENVNDLQILTQKDLTPHGPVISKIRIQALKETSLSIGAQGGLAMRSKQIDNLLEDNKKQLDRIFNFSGLMLDNNVLPPVLETSDASLTLASGDTINIADRTYRIVKQAHFVTAPPTWRDFLWLDYQKPPLPDSTLLPRSKQERDIWKKYVNIGWKKGITQANNIFMTNVASLKRDYAGMMLYRDLLSKHMVTEPFVATDNMGVTSNTEHTEMRINDKVLRITVVPELNVNSNRWKPVMIKNDDSQ